MRFLGRRNLSLCIRDEWVEMLMELRKGLRRIEEVLRRKGGREVVVGIGRCGVYIGIV
jgi:hypothetical protein